MWRMKGTSAEGADCDFPYCLERPIPISTSQRSRTGAHTVGRTSLSGTENTAEHVIQPTASTIPAGPEASIAPTAPRAPVAIGATVRTVALSAHVSLTPRAHVVLMLRGYVVLMLRAYVVLMLKADMVLRPRAAHVMPIVFGTRGACVVVRVTTARGPRLARLPTTAEAMGACNVTGAKGVGVPFRRGPTAWERGSG